MKRLCAFSGVTKIPSHAIIQKRGKKEGFKQVFLRQKNKRKKQGRKEVTTNAKGQSQDDKSQDHQGQDHQGQDQEEEVEEYCQRLVAVACPMGGDVLRTEHRVGCPALISATYQADSNTSLNLVRQSLI
jgi:hypothetical protein